MTPRPGDTLRDTAAVQYNEPRLVVLNARTVVLMNVRKILGTLAIVLLVFFVISQPGRAAMSVRSIGNSLAGAGQSMIEFVTQVFA
jgi:hypothetical protein